MLTFAQYLARVSESGELVNTLFEERVYEIVGVLHRIADVFSDAHIEYELVGGLAVFVHVEKADPSQSVMTRDVDLMVYRNDLEKIKRVAAEHGFRFRHTAGLDMLLHGDVVKAINAVHLIFTGERVRPTQAVPNPKIQPDVERIHGKEVQIIPVSDLVRMKLSAFRDKDRVHIRSMDAAGLITPDMEAGLPAELTARLRNVRETE